MYINLITGEGVKEHSEILKEVKKSKEDLIKIFEKLGISVPNKEHEVTYFEATY